jgi:hypothetical protein
MIEISAEAPEKSIVDFVKRWMKLLADNRLDDACALLDEPNYYGYMWTPELIRQTVNEIFSPDTRFYIAHPEGPVFTDPFELKEQRHLEVIELSDENGYAFDYDIPLNGEWSDLTAQFEFLKRTNAFAVVLHDFHVL